MGRGFYLQAKSVQSRYIPKKANHELLLQSQICTYIKMQYPHVIFKSDYGAGLKLTIAQAATQKRLNSSRSFPDLFIYHPITRGDTHYCGLALELKKEGTAIVVSRGPRKGQLVQNEHIREQYMMLRALAKVGYCANFAVGFDDAKKKIDAYFGRIEPENTTIF